MLAVHHRVLSTHRLWSSVAHVERAKRAREVHIWGNVPLHPSLVFIIVIIYITVWTREQPPVRVPWTHLVQLTYRAGP